MLKKNLIFLFFILFFFNINIIFAKKITFYNKNLPNNLSGKVIEIKNNTVKILNSENNKIETLSLDRNEISQLKKGDILVIKQYNQNKKLPQCKCFRIRERIKKLAEKRKLFQRLRRNSNRHYNNRGRKR